MVSKDIAVRVERMVAQLIFSKVFEKIDTELNDFIEISIINSRYLLFFRERLKLVFEKYMVRSHANAENRQSKRREVSFQMSLFFGRWLHPDKEKSPKYSGRAISQMGNPTAKQIWRLRKSWLSGAVSIPTRWTGCSGSQD